MFLLHRDGLLDCEVEAAQRVNPFAPKKPALAATATSVISLFMHGGPSHIDTFDPKPLLVRLEGQRVPDSFGTAETQFSDVAHAPLLASRRTFKRAGQSGIEVSDLFPHLAVHADDLAVVRSCYHDAFTHTAALDWLSTGWPRLGRPSVGSWVVYGLGTESENLPGYVVLVDGSVKSGPAAYGSGFLPAMYQGTVLRSDTAPILNASPPPGSDPATRRRMLDLLTSLNEQHLVDRADDTALSARLASYELAFRMQVAAPELADLSQETPATQRLYGMDHPETRAFGAKCLMARRLVERGVRFVQIYSGNGTTGDDWDGHRQCDENHLTMARRTDKPIAGLLADLRSRGLLASTLVTWGGEFGRTPTSDGNATGIGDRGGRDHNPHGFSVWLAGGGVRGGQIVGATDEIGLRAIDDLVHPHDLHATMLTLLGLDHERLTYVFQGRKVRLTDVGGENNLGFRLRSSN